MSGTIGAVVTGIVILGLGAVRDPLIELFYSPKTVEDYISWCPSLDKSKGLQAVLQCINKALEKYPSCTTLYWLRYEQYRNLNKFVESLEDLKTIITLQPDTLESLYARYNRIHIKVMLGHIAGSQEDLNVLESYPRWRALLSGSEPPSGSWPVTRTDLRKTLDSAAVNRRKAYRAAELEQHQDAIDIVSHIIKDSPSDLSILELGLECTEAIQDTETFEIFLSSLRQYGYVKPEWLLTAAQMRYEEGRLFKALKLAEECVNKKPEFTACRDLYDQVSVMYSHLDSVYMSRTLGEWGECVSSAERMLNGEQASSWNISFMAFKYNCLCYANLETADPLHVIDICTEGLSYRDDTELFMSRAAAYETIEDYEEAVNDYERVLEISGDHAEARRRLETTSLLITGDSDKARDYYEILGVNRNATKAEILKAYRKLALKWHPDKHKGYKKLRAHRKLMDINAAKEVLTDPDKRSLFNQGVDPLKPRGGRRW